MREATGLVLAGGKSSRMGRPKAWIDFGGEPLLARIVRVVGTVCPEVLVAAAPGQDLPATPARVVPDESPGLGPLSGLEVGFSEASHGILFVTSCDVPLLRPAVIERLLDRADGYDVVASEWDGHTHPLTAIYRRSILPRVREHIAAGRLRPVHLFEKVRTRVLHKDDFADVDPALESWENLNTPEELERALARLGREVEVELVGLPRHLAAAGSVRVRLRDGATVGDLVGAIAERVPGLVGDVIAPDRVSLTADHAVATADRVYLRDPAAPLPSGRLMLIGVPAGG